MSVLQLEFDDKEFASLQEQALAVGMPIEFYAKRVLLNTFATPSSLSTPPKIDKDQLNRLVEESIQENDELYKRLAK